MGRGGSGKNVWGRVDKMVGSKLVRSGKFLVQGPRRRLEYCNPFVAETLFHSAAFCDIITCPALAGCDFQFW